MLIEEKGKLRGDDKVIYEDTRVITTVELSERLGIQRETLDNATMLGGVERAQQSAREGEESIAFAIDQFPRLVEGLGQVSIPESSGRKLFPNVRKVNTHENFSVKAPSGGTYTYIYPGHEGSPEAINLLPNRLSFSIRRSG